MTRRWLLGGTMATMIAAPLVIAWEGKSNITYSDPVGIPTACYGHTHGVQLGQIYTDAECEQLLISELTKAEAAVKRLITVPLSPETSAAVISFTYNAGEGNLAKSTLRRKMNAGDIRGGCMELRKWVYSKKKFFQGLANRREAELALCLKGA